MKGSIKSVWKNKKQILEGIKNSIFTNDTVEQISKERMDVCNNCENIDREGSYCVAGKSSAPCCKLCGCCLHIATRSLAFVCKANKFKTYFSDIDSLNISITLNYKNKLEHLLKENIIDVLEYNELLEDLTGENVTKSITAKFKINSFDV